MYKSENLISVVVATFNGEKYIRKQIDSILNQSYKNIEIIAIDDCSEDSTASILKTYNHLENFNLIINKKNIGVVKNFEKGVSIAQGEFIALSDQDDIWETNKLMELHLSIGSFGMIYSDANIIDKNDDFKNQSLSDSFIFHGLQSGDINLFKALIFQGVAWGCTMLISRNVAILSIPFPEVSKNHDWWISIVAYCNGGIKYHPEKLIHYRHHSNNVSRSDDKNSMLKVFMDFFSTNALKARNDYYNKCYNDLLEVLKPRSSINFNSFEKKLLQKYLSYNSQGLKRRNRFLRFIFAFKNRDYLFSSETNLIKILHSISKIF